MLTALSVGMAFCHLMEIPARLNYAPALWSRVTNIESDYVRLLDPVARALTVASSPDHEAHSDALGGLPAPAPGEAGCLPMP